MTISQKIIHGLLILDKYEGNAIGVGHEIIYAGPYRPAAISHDDECMLLDLGWFFDSTLDTWCRGV